MKMHLAVPAVVISLAAVLPGAAQASIIPVLDSVTADGSNFLFSYGGELAADQGVTFGDKLVIVDFAGYVAGSIHSSLLNVVASVSNTLPIGLLLDPGFTDNSAIPDLVFTYTGTDFRTNGGPFSTAIDFTGLTAESTLGGTTGGSFSAIAVKNSGRQAGTAAFNVGEVSVPSGVPEPGVWAMLLSGFFGVGFMMRSARKVLGRAVAFRS